jgi:ribosomal protein S30
MPFARALRLRTYSTLLATVNIKIVAEIPRIAGHPRKEIIPRRKFLNRLNAERLVVDLATDVPIVLMLRFAAVAADHAALPSVRSDVLN